MMGSVSRWCCPLALGLEGLALCEVSVHLAKGAMYFLCKAQNGPETCSEAGLTLACGIGLKFCVAGSFVMVHMCVKFHGHWTNLASTCFTRCPADQNFTIDDALNWWMGFGSNLVWWGYIGLGSCTKSFKATGFPYHALPSQCPLAAYQLWEFWYGVWLVP